VQRNVDRAVREPTIAPQLIAIHIADIVLRSR